MSKLRLSIPKRMAPLRWSAVFAVLMLGATADLDQAANAHPRHSTRAIHRLGRGSPPALV